MTVEYSKYRSRQNYYSKVKIVFIFEKKCDTEKDSRHYTIATVGQPLLSYKDVIHPLTYLLNDIKVI
jgi:hypothetical protein